MFPELNSILEWDSQGPPDEKCITVLERGSDASFVVHHSLCYYIKNNYNVCFLALQQSFSHYANVAKKLGVNLGEAKEKNQLVFIEGLKSIGAALTNADSESSSSSEWTNMFGTNDGESKLKNLYLKLKEVATSQNSPLLILIDDLTLLLYLGIEVKELVQFYCCLTQLSRSSQQACVLTLMHLDANEGTLNEDEPVELVSRYLQHYSDVVIDVRGLQTGYSREVHGQLTVEWRDRSQTHPGGTKKPTEMQFRVYDRTISFFALGTSSIVL